MKTLSKVIVPGRRATETAMANSIHLISWLRSKTVVFKKVQGWRAMPCPNRHRSYYLLHVCVLSHPTTSSSVVVGSLKFARFVDGVTQPPTLDRNYESGTFAAGSNWLRSNLTVCTRLSLIILFVAWGQAFSYETASTADEAVNS